MLQCLDLLLALSLGTRVPLGCLLVEILADRQSLLVAVQRVPPCSGLPCCLLLRTVLMPQMFVLMGEVFGVLSTLSILY